MRSEIGPILRDEQKEIIGQCFVRATSGEQQGRRMELIDAFFD